MKVLDALKLKFTKGLSRDLDVAGSEYPVDLTPLAAEPKPKAPQIKGTKFRQMLRKPIEGRTYNPMKSFPVNLPCFCGSLMKAKRCCMPYLSATCSKEFADSIKAKWNLILKGEEHLPRAPKNHQ